MNTTDEGEGQPMGGGFEVVNEDLRASGRAMEDAAEQARALDVAARVRQVATAMPTSATAGAAAVFERAWSRQLGRWTGAATLHGEALRTSARDYDSVDAAVDTALTRAGAEIR